MALADRLREEGIDAILDQYEEAPPEGWMLWAEKQIRDADFVLLVCTETYRRRVTKEEVPGRGLGVCWEAQIIYQHIYEDATRNTRFLPVLLGGGEVADIPTPLRAFSHYEVDTEEGREDLFRRLTNQPRTVKPAIGKPRSLLPRERKPGAAELIAGTQRRWPEADWLGELTERVDEIAEKVLGSYEPRSYRGNKIIRDTIWGVTSCFPHELAIIDSPLMQRLRRVHQTALAFFTYPCSGHSRFEHSLGVLGAVEKVLKALGERDVPVEISKPDRLEVRLAALLHDVAHGPLSHSSESFYQADPIFDRVRAQYPDLFGKSQQPTASASEILTYALLTGKRFGDLWKKILKNEEGSERIAGLLQCDWSRIATMILGQDINPIPGTKSMGPSKRYLRQMVNGPFDVDKLDYIARDSYFTGLSIMVDVERLLWTIDRLHIPNENAQGLCVSPSGAIILEQVLFAKMQLYSSLYHHHKVRAAHQSFIRLLNFLKQNNVRISGSEIHPAAFIGWDDYDLLHGCCGNVEADRLARAILSREFPLRAVVLSYPTWGPSQEKPDDSYQKEFVRQMALPGAVQSLEAEIEGAAGTQAGSVWVDIPREPSLLGAANEALVKLDKNTGVPLQEMHPVGGWLSAYAKYRSVSYVFAPHPVRSAVADATIDVLGRKGIVVNSTAKTLAQI